MNKLVLFVLLLVASNSLYAVVVNYQGEAYKIETIFGSYADNSSLLESQIWWNDPSLAREFSNLVGGSLGYPHLLTTNYSGLSFGYAPMFGWAPGGGYAMRDDRSASSTIGYSGQSEWNYAVVIAAEIPIPAAYLLFGSALAAVGFGKRKVPFSISISYKHD